MADICILQARPNRAFAPIAQEIAKRLHAGKESIVLVPEQFTLGAELQLMRFLQVRGFFHVDVMSPSHLYEEVLEFSGHDAQEPLSQAGRRIAVFQAAEMSDSRLAFYRKLRQRRGFVEKMNAFITDMKRGGLLPEVLAKYAEGLEDGLTKAKLTDIAIIYENYEKLLSGRFSDGVDLLDYAAGRLEKSGYVKGRHIFVYGFDTLPQQMMRFLAKAALLCDGMTIALSCDGETAPDGMLFQPIRQVIGRFHDLAIMKGLTVEERHIFTPLSDAAPEIQYMDRSFLAEHAKPYEESVRNVFFCKSKTPYEECTLAGREILSLLQAGTDPSRIAVFYPGNPEYRFAVSAALGDSGIPFYTDEKLQATSHGLVRYMLFALRAMNSRWQNRDMSAVLDSGYSGLEYNEICDLKNYAFENGIQRDAWESPFEKGKDDALRSRCEAARQLLMEPLLKARNAIVQASNARESMEALYTLLLDVDAYGRLCAEEKLLQEKGFAERAGQNSQLWKSILDVMDQMVRLCGEHRIPLKSFSTRLEAGFGAVSLSSLPPVGGMIHAGVLGHMIQEEADAVFVLGLTDSLLDKETVSLLAEEEREELENGTRDDNLMKTVLGLTDRTREDMALLDLKKAFTLPRKQLYLSACATGAKGQDEQVLPCVEHLCGKDLLGTVPKRPFSAVNEDGTFEYSALPASPVQKLNTLGFAMRSATKAAPLSAEDSNDLNSLLHSKESGRHAGRLLRAVSTRYTPERLNKDTADRLFSSAPGERTLSVTKLEAYAECPYAQFLKNGLRLRELKKWEPSAQEKGIFYHEVMDRFYKRVCKNTPDLNQYSDEEITQLTDEIVAPLLEELSQGPMGDSYTSRAELRSVNQIIHRSVQSVVNQLQSGLFTPIGSEICFGMGGNSLPPIILVLNDGTEVRLQGKIDRLDVMDGVDKDRTPCLRVVDFKSSQNNLSAQELWAGLQLQLMLYLQVCLEAYPGSIPGGAFYFHVCDPYVEIKEDFKGTLKEAAEDAIAKAMNLKGIVLEGLKLYNDQGPKTKNNMNLEEYRLLLSHVRKAAQALAQRMFDGDIVISPVKKSQDFCCKYCKQNTVCRFSPNDMRFHRRSVPNMEYKELKERLREEAGQQTETP